MEKQATSNKQQKTSNHNNRCHYTTNPTQCSICFREIPKTNNHTFVLFDPPQMGNDSWPFEQPTTNNPRSNSHTANCTSVSSSDPILKPACNLSRKDRDPGFPVTTRITCLGFGIPAYKNLEKCHWHHGWGFRSKYLIFAWFGFLFLGGSPFFLKTAAIVWNCLIRSLTCSASSWFCSQWIVGGDWCGCLSGCSLC